MNDTAFKELRIPLRHLTLAAKAWGNPADPPILAVHGWLDNAGSFDRLAPLLDGHYLVAVDLAGHGRSDHRPAGTWYPFADYLDDIGKLIKRFGWPSVDLLGHSLGAALVSTYAAICPQQVRRLLLIEGLGPLTQSADKTLDQLRKSHAARDSFTSDGLRVFANLDEAIAARCHSGNLSGQAARSIVERGVKAVAGNPGGSGIDSTWQVPGTTLTGLDIRSGDGAACLDTRQASAGLSWSSDPQLTVPSSTRLTEDQLADVLAAIVAPTCLILAEPNAPYMPPAMVENRIALLGEIEVVRMTGTHHLHLEEPQPVATALREFLQRHSS
ncbi:MAG TPA: alpha/beta hydrolase [Dokdonella sp.]|uniref:alpha/beta fold hydrolase n=1 Tax=Dokdonella sp. TaxID=2291710 RepID=UPI002D80E01D|nr:alpha/beta hydrolase [Dokdonella sp.]HET9033023.1 alpha/beta hydrolase [Dokdonella sp.]